MFKRMLPKSNHRNVRTPTPFHNCLKEFADPAPGPKIVPVLRHTSGAARSEERGCVTLEDNCKIHWAVIKEFGQGRGKK